MSTLTATLESGRASIEPWASEPESHDGGPGPGVPGGGGGDRLRCAVCNSREDCDCELPEQR